MKKVRFAVLTVGCAVAASAHAQLTTAHSYTGNYGVELRAFASSGASSASNSVTFTDMPAGSTIVDAFLYTNSWFSGGTANGTINGNSVGSTPVYSNQADVYSYKWNVTTSITGNGTYTVDLSGVNQIYFGAIAVVFSHPSLVAGTTVINDGVAILNGPLGGPTNSTIFNNLAAGPSRVQLVTQADNAQGQSGEIIRWNGGAIGGPIDANLGEFASLFDFAVNSQLGSNTLSIDAPTGDHFGWHIAVVSNGLIPAPGSAVLLGFAGLAATRRRRA